MTARPRYIPEGAKEIKQEETNHVVYLYENFGKPCAIAYGGKRTKPDFQYKYESEQRREQHINEYLENRKKIKELKVEQKQAQKDVKQKAFGKVSVGDVFSASWGYEQTNVNFYKLLELKGKTGLFVELGAITVDNNVGHDCDYRKADINREIGEPFKARLNGDTFKVNESIRPSRLEDPTKKHYCSWYY